MPTADGSSEETAAPAGERPGRSRTPWPHGRRRNWRAALMLAAAAVLMAAGLSIWSSLEP